MGKTFILCDHQAIAEAIGRAVGAEVSNGGDVGQGEYVFFWPQFPLVSPAKPESLKPEWGSPWRFDVLPMLPHNFPCSPVSGREADVKRLNELLCHEEVEHVVVATTPGQEGSFSFEQVYQTLSHKVPAYRVFIWSLATNDVLAAMGKGVEFELVEPLAREREALAKLDWLLSSNLTRATTLALGPLTIFSREAIAILGWCFERQRIMDKKPCYLTASFFLGGKLVTGRALEDQDYSVATFWEEEALELRKGCSLTAGEVEAVTRTEEKVAPPLPLNLAELQKKAYRQYHLSACRTAQVAKSLYMQGCITWPETDVRELIHTTKESALETLMAIHAYDVEKVDTAIDVLEAEQTTQEFAGKSPLGVSGPILPTSTVLRAENCSEEEWAIYRLIADSFILSLLPESTETHTEVVVNLEGAMFLIESHHIEIPGWRGFTQDKLDGEFSLTDGEILRPIEIKPTPLFEPLTEADIIEVLASEEFGTPYSRTKALEFLYRQEWILLDGGRLILTDRGRVLLESLEGLNSHGMKDFFSIESSQEWLAHLYEKAHEGEQDFYRLLNNEISKKVSDIVSQLWSDLRVDAPCPLCGAPILKAGSSYKCEKWEKEPENGCSFSVYGQLGDVEVPPAMLVEMLEDDEGISESKLQFVSTRTGNPYQAQTKVDKDTWSISRHFPKQEKNAVGICPLCEDGEILEKEKFYSCSNWKDKDCRLSINKGIDGPSPEDVQQLLRDGKTSRAFTYEREGRRRRFLLRFDGTKVRKVKA